MQTIVSADPRPIFVHNYIDSATLQNAFEYVTKSVNLEKLTEEMGKMFSCSCVGRCRVNTDCVCAIKHGGIPKFSYDSKGKLMVRYNHHGQGIIYECNDECSCDRQKCPNRVIQHGSSIPLQLFRTVDNRGWGVRSLQWIPRGAFVAEYTGEIMDEGIVDLARSRYDQIYGNTFLFDLDALESDDSQEPNELEVPKRKFTLDARFYGSIARWFNHCCDPNLISVSFVVNEPVQLQRIAFFSKRDICAGDELTFDYEDGQGLKGEELYKLAKSGKRALMEDSHLLKDCRCGALKCRGKVSIG